MEHPLTRFRADRKLTMEAFGALIGASKSMVSKWEAGTATPRRAYAEKVFEVTAGVVTPNDFVLRPVAEAA